MPALTPYLAELWIGVIAFLLLYYVIADGVVLGMGMLSLCNPEEKEREIMLGSLLSTWHSNQTWLIVVGGIMFGAFPLFYGLVLTALYIPVYGMLCGFLIRGVALDYWHESARKRPWELAFGLGSLLATLSQGFALGGLLGGIQMENGRFNGGMMDWATLYGVFITAGLILGYLMLGANFMVLKMEGGLQQRGYRYAMVLAPLNLAAVVGGYALIFSRHPHLQERWLLASAPDYLLLLPALGLMSFLLLIYSLWKRHERMPLLWNVAINIFSFSGVALGLYPQMIPNVIGAGVTIQQAAAQPRTLFFMLIILGVAIPFILVYTSYEFWVFRGKAGNYYQKEKGKNP